MVYATDVVPRFVHAQGDTIAHEFYVVEEGACDVFVRPQGGGKPNKVQAYKPGR